MTTVGKITDTILALSFLGALLANYTMDLGLPEWLVVGLAAGAGLASRKTPGGLLDRKKT